MLERVECCLVCLIVDEYGYVNVWLDVLPEQCFAVYSLLPKYTCQVVHDYAIECTRSNQ